MNQKRIQVILLAIGVVASFASDALAQRGGWGRYRGGDISTNRRGVPTWEVDKSFPGDLFTFARIRYESWGRRDAWATDYPDSDLNFSLRLQQLTTIKVNPDPVDHRVD